MTSDPEPLLCVVGPTASGKSRLAIDICRRYGAEIVGADATQVYRGLDIGSGKCTRAELGGVRHHLIDRVEPDEPFDAGIYVAHADRAIAEIRERGHRVVLCGGTGLYLRALLDGLCAAPRVDPAVRRALRERLEAGEVEALHQALGQVDPVAAARIGPRDRQRIERALGVYQTSGRPLSAWQAEQAGAAPRHRARWIGLQIDREVLRARIAERVDEMLRAGFEDEVRALLAAGYGVELKSLGALGYRHLAAVVRGALTRAEARDRIIADTRRYAKRQRTWFGRLPDVHWLAVPVDRAHLDAYLRRFWPEGQGSDR